MAFRPVIEEAPGQVYASALLYSPLQSSVRRNFKDIVPQGIKLKPQPPERWSPCLQTLSCNYLPLMVAFSRDGKLLTTSGWAFSSSNPSRYQCLDIWDPQTGECQSYLKAYVKEPVIEKLSPNGHMVVSVSSDGILRLWDMAESEDRFILENHPSPITAAEFSFDSQSLALGSQDGTIRLLDTTTGECRCSFEGHSESIRFLVFSPDCTIIATGAADETVHIWNLQTGSHHLAIACQAFSLWPEGDLYVYGDDPYVYGEVVFSPDSRFLAAGSANKAVRVWDVVNGKCRFNLEGHSRKLCMVIFSPTGQLLASGSLDHTVRLWDMQTGDCRSIFEGFQVGMAFSPDGQFLAFGSRGYLVRLWSVQDEEYRSVLDGHTSSVNTICFSPDGQFLVSGSWDLTVRIWDMHLGQYPPNVEPIMDDHLRRVIFSPNGEIVASESRKNKIRLWNPETGESCLDYEGKGASFSSDGQLMISTSEDEVRLLELRTKTHRFLSKGDSRFAVLSPDGQLAAVASSDNSVQLWNTQNNNETFTFEGHPGEIQQLVFSPTGDLIASGAKYDDVRIWDTKTGEHIANFRNSFGLFDMTFAPNGELLASGSWLWDVPAGCLRFDLEGGNEEIHAFVFSPNSQLVAGPSWDSKVHLWDTRTGEHLLTVPYQSMNPRIEFLTGIDAVFVDGTAYEIGSAKMTKVEIAHHSRLLSDLLIDSSGEWVTRSSKRVLWLPPERRPYDYAVWRNKIAIGSNDGRMTFLTFEEEPSRQSGDGQGREERMALRLRN